MGQYRAVVKRLNGAPSLFVNDAPVFLNSGYLAKAPYDTFSPMGSGLYLVHDHHFGVSEKGEVDVKTIEGIVRGVLDREPTAYVIVRSMPPAPKWWLDANPEDVMGFDLPMDGVQDGEYYRDVSWASDKWLETISGWYTTWVGHLHKKFDGRVIGHQFGMGAHGENGAKGAPAYDGRWFCADFSPVMVKWFRGWLRRKYGSDAALRAGWSDDAVTLEMAQVPGRVERLRTDWFTFRSPMKAQVSDYYQAYADRVRETVLKVCRVMKKATDGEAVVGTHLGAIQDVGFHGWIYNQLSTSLFRQSLEDPAIDLFTSPATYEGRDPGGDACSMMPHGSLRLHDKLIYQDQDTRTHLVPAGYAKAYTLGKIASNSFEATNLLKRDFAHGLIHGYGFWWHPMVKGMYDGADIQDCLARLQRIGQASLGFERGPAPGMAMIVDEESAFHQQCSNRLFYPMMYLQRQQMFGRTGLSWAPYLHNDLEHKDFPETKAYYFLNTFFLTDEEVKQIKRKLAGSGAVVVWTYAPGIQSPTGIDLARASDLCGMRLKALDVETLPQVTLTALDHPLIRIPRPVIGDPYAAGDLPPVTVGTGRLNVDDRERSIGPVIYVDDAKATMLGELSALRLPGLCVKEVDGWTSVYSSAPMLHQMVLRSIGASAGLHVYSHGDDVVLPGKSFLMIHATSAGRKRIFLPRVGDVYDPYEGVEVGRGVREVVLEMREFETRILYLGGGEGYLRGA